MFFPFAMLMDAKEQQMSALKYQDIEVMLKEENAGPKLRQIIQFLHAENSGLKQEINGICMGLDRLIESVNAMAAVAGLHSRIFTGLENGKSMSDIVSELRREELSDFAAEEIKHG
jgi:hypothetical protein